MTIEKLPPQLANQIAAGEVVERPASVVKELVENALDAEATRIDIEIEKGGHKRILIRDDGKGVSKDQLTLALSRHATSKIKNIDDLEAIMSLGFRGEALASISSVARLTMTSKPATQNEAWSAMAEGLDMAVQIKPAAHPNGTSVDVVDLFFNTPARRKFLRAEKTEFSHIEALIKRIALSRPDVTFILKHNGKQVRRYRRYEVLIETQIDAQIGAQQAKLQAYTKRIQDVVGNGFTDSSANCELNYDNIQLKAWVKSPESCVSVNPAQYAFVNDRMMRDKLIQHAIRQAFADALHPEQQPEYVIFIQLPATEVDVNVHPAKHEVRFHQARLLHDLVVRVIQDALNGFDQAQDDKSLDAQVPTSPPTWLAEPNRVYQEAVAQTQVPKSEFVPTSGSSPTREAKRQYSPLKSSTNVRGEPAIGQRQRLAFDAYASATEVVPETPTPVENSDAQTHLAENASSNAQIHLIQHGRYVFIGLGEDMYLVDWQQVYPVQDSARTLSSDALQPTPLLVPVRLRLKPEEIAWYQNNQTVLQEHGFVCKQIDAFLIIKQVPNLVRQSCQGASLPLLFETMMAQVNLAATDVKGLLLKSPEFQLSPEEVRYWLNALPGSKADELSKVGIRLEASALLGY